jgi:hypothetical protein
MLRPPVIQGQTTRNLSGIHLSGAKAMNARRKCESRRPAKSERRIAAFLWRSIHPLVDFGVAHDGLHILPSFGEWDGLDELCHVAEVA